VRRSTLLAFVTFLSVVNFFDFSLNKYPQALQSLDPHIFTNVHQLTLPPNMAKNILDKSPVVVIICLFFKTIRI
jgi:hypothetical protein